METRRGVLLVMSRWLRAGDVLPGGLRIMERKGENVIVEREGTGEQFVAEVAADSFIELDYRDEPKQPKEPTKD